jgi:hypothetical protein
VVKNTFSEKTFLLFFLFYTALSFFFPRLFFFLSFFVDFVRHYKVETKWQVLTTNTNNKTKDYVFWTYVCVYILFKHV